MIAEWDKVVKEPLWKINSNEIMHYHIGHNNQNELISLLSLKVMGKIIQKVKEAKYFQLSLNCTPDTSHQEQMTLI